jgi:hypothetical protein
LVLNVFDINTVWGHGVISSAAPSPPSRKAGRASRASLFFLLYFSSNL